MSTDLEYRNGMAFGVGIDSLTGGIQGSGVVPGQPSTVSDGLTVSYLIDIIEGTESLYTSLAVTVKMQGQFGLSGGKGKVSFAESANFNSHSTFVIARTIVQKSFEQCLHPVLEESAKQLVQDGKLDVFLERYGNGFVRGIQMGGEFCAVIEITAETKERQMSLAANLKANYGGIARGSMSYSQIEQSTSSYARTKIATYQAGGAGDDTSLPNDIEKVLKRLEDFPKIIDKKPVAFSVQVADYTTLDDWPEVPLPIDRQIQEESMEEYARIRRTLLVKIKDVEFIKLNPNFFVNPPSPAKLNEWSTFFSDQLAQLEKRMKNCIHSHRECTPFPMQVPGDYFLPERVAGLSKFEGKWQRENTQAVLQLTVKGGDVSGKIIEGDGDYTHEYYGKIRNNNENVADMVCLRTINNCTTKMYMTFTLTNNVEMESITSGTDGNCDLPTNFTEGPLKNRRIKQQ